MKNFLTLFLLNQNIFTSLIELFSNCASKCFIFSQLLFPKFPDPFSIYIFFKYSSISVSVRPLLFGSSYFRNTLISGTSLNLNYCKLKNRQQCLKHWFEIYYFTRLVYGFEPDWWCVRWWLLWLVLFFF